MEEFIKTEFISVTEWLHYASRLADEWYESKMIVFHY